MTTLTGIGARQDHTKGTFEISESPFKSAQALAYRLSADGGLWQIQIGHVGGQGDVTQAIECDSRQSVNLWQDARSGWWIQKELRPGWLVPDIDATLALARPARNDDATASGNYTREEVEYMRNPG